MSNSESIIKRAGAQWVGIQESNNGPIILFRDPVTMSTLGLLEQGLTVCRVTARINDARKSFGASK